MAKIQSFCDNSKSLAKKGIIWSQQASLIKDADSPHLQAVYKPQPKTSLHVVEFSREFMSADRPSHP